MKQSSIPFWIPTAAYAEANLEQLLSPQGLEGVTQLGKRHMLGSLSLLTPFNNKNHKFNICPPSSTEFGV